MRRILRSVCLLAVCALACAVMTSFTARHAPASSSQSPGSQPDSSFAPPDQGNLPDEPLGPGPEVGPEPSEPPPSEQPGAGTQSAPNAGAPADTTHAGAPADTTHAGAPADTTHAGAGADTTGGFLPALGAKPAAEAPFDTLSLPTTTPTNSSAGPAVGGPHAAPPPAAVPPKPRTGILGIHPVAILLGLAALNYFVIKAATN